MSHSTIDTPTLGEALNRYGPTAARTHAEGTHRLTSTTVDSHAHVAVPAAGKYMAPYVDVMKMPLARFASDETNAINAKQDADRSPVTMISVEDRLRVLDAQGIDIQIVAPPPPQCYYFSPIEHAVVGTRMLNDGIAEWVGHHPDRLLGLGSVPLQDPAEAVTELDRCVNDLGLKGVMLLTNMDGEEIGDDRFRPFWKRAEELGALVMLHPNGFTGGERFENYYFSNVIGNPLDTTVALHYLIYNGVLRDMPKLKILAVHGGGYLPSYSGRIDHAWGARADVHTDLPKPPTEYLKQVYIDSVVFTHHQLEYLVSVFGADHVLMGSDYPFDMAEYDPVGHIATSALSDDEKARIGGLNALRLLGLKA